MTVQKQLKALVGADMNADGWGGRFKLPAKTQKNRLPPATRKNFSVCRRGNVRNLRIPYPRGCINWLNRENPGVSQMKPRRQKNLLDLG